MATNVSERIHTLQDAPPIGLTVLTELPEPLGARDLIGPRRPTHDPQRI